MKKSQRTIIQGIQENPGQGDIRNFQAEARSQFQPVGTFKKQEWDTYPQLDHHRN